MLPKSEHIAVDPRHGVGVPRRQEVIFRDGSRIWLQRIDRAEGPDLFRRKVGGLVGQTVEVDLRELAPDLAEDLPRAETRDMPALVHFSLRTRFPGAHQLFAAAGGPAQ